jgi:hypothetical protein
VIDDDGAIVGALTAESGSDAVRRALWSLRSTPVHGSMMIRRSALSAVGGYRTAFRFGQDYDLWLRMSAEAEIDTLPEALYRWRLGAAGVYATRRAAQLKYAGLALVFARERVASGSDAYDLLEACGGDLDRFASQYSMGSSVYAIWGELLLRGLGNSRAVRDYLRRAVFAGDRRLRTLCLLAWTLFRLPWPGGRPIVAPEA